VAALEKAKFTQLREVQMADQRGRSQLEIFGSMKMTFPCFPSFLDDSNSIIEDSAQGHRLPNSTKQFMVFNRSWLIDDSWFLDAHYSASISLVGSRSED